MTDPHATYCANVDVYGKAYANTVRKLQWVYLAEKPEDEITSEDLDTAFAKAVATVENQLPALARNRA
jgi:hypothetical protein